MTGLLPQWRTEAFAARTPGNKTVAVMRGNGARHIMIVRSSIGQQHSLDLEDLAAGEGPRLARPWTKYGLFVTRPKIPSNTTPAKDHTEVEQGAKPSSPVVWTLKPLSTLPSDFWLTRLMCSLLLVMWILLLISISSIDNNTWYLFAVGALGSLHNAFSAASSIDPGSRGIHSHKEYYISGTKVMDVLMDLERIEERLGRSLVNEFFPAGLDKGRGEDEWWEFPKTRLVFKGQENLPANFVMLPGHEHADSLGEPIEGSDQIGKYDSLRMANHKRARFGLHDIDAT